MRQQITGSGISLVDGPLWQAERFDRVQRAADAIGATLNVQGLFGDLDFCERDDCLGLLSGDA